MAAESEMQSAHMNDLDSAYVVPDPIPTLGQTALVETSPTPSAASIQTNKTGFLWLEITGKCQRECEHCYANSSPRGTHGTMTEQDWMRVIDEGAENGVNTVQFIGGEPTLNPALPRLIQCALRKGLKVEVFSNLERVRPEIWEAVSQEGVSLATSYYSSNGVEHDSIVRRNGSYDRTKDNIAEAVRRGVPIRVGVIGVREGQDTDEAIRELVDLGVAEAKIGLDFLRQVGRGTRDQDPSTAQLCGNCANGVLAILPDGSVQPCVFSRWSEMNVGNIHENTLGSIFDSARLGEVRSLLREVFALRHPNENADPLPLGSVALRCLPEVCNPLSGPCVPDMCNPNLMPCDPSQRPTPDRWPDCWPGQNCGPTCGPACYPQGNCVPQVGNPCAPETYGR